MSHINELFSLTEKTAVVIGGGGVLAGAMATALASAGCNIAILDLSVENAENRAAEIAKYGVQSLAFACDVTNKSDLIGICGEILSKWGRVDILINAAVGHIARHLSAIRDNGERAHITRTSAFDIHRGN